MLSSHLASLGQYMISASAMALDSFQAKALFELAHANAGSKESRHVRLNRWAYHSNHLIFERGAHFVEGVERALGLPQYLLSVIKEEL